MSHSVPSAPQEVSFMNLFTVYCAWHKRTHAWYHAINIHELITSLLLRKHEPLSAICPLRSLFMNFFSFSGVPCFAQKDTCLISCNPVMYGCITGQTAKQAWSPKNVISYMPFSIYEYSFHLERDTLCCICICTPNFWLEIMKIIKNVSYSCNPISWVKSETKKEFWIES